MLPCLRHLAPQVRSPWPTCPGGMNKHDRVPLSSHSGDPPVWEPRRDDTGSLPNQRTIHISNALTLNEPQQVLAGFFSYILYCLRKFKIELFCYELSHLHSHTNSTQLLVNGNRDLKNSSNRAYGYPSGPVKRWPLKPPPPNPPSAIGFCSANSCIEWVEKYFAANHHQWPKAQSTEVVILTRNLMAQDNSHTMAEGHETWMSVSERNNLSNWNFPSLIHPSIQRPCHSVCAEIRVNLLSSQLCTSRQRGTLAESIFITTTIKVFRIPITNALLGIELQCLTLLVKHTILQGKKTETKKEKMSFNFTPFLQEFVFIFINFNGDHRGSLLTFTLPTIYRPHNTTSNTMRAKTLLAKTLVQHPLNRFGRPSSFIPFEWLNFRMLV